MFHNGGLKSVTVASNEDRVLTQAAKYGMKTCSNGALQGDTLAELLQENELVVIYLSKPKNMQVEALVHCLVSKKDSVSSSIALFP